MQLIQQLFEYGYQGWIMIAVCIVGAQFWFVPRVEIFFIEQDLHLHGGFIQQGGVHTGMQEKYISV